MSEETLLTAAHRFSRAFKVDMEAGGMVVDETLAASRTFDREIRLAEAGKPHHQVLLQPSREAARDFNLDMTKHGGLVSTKTEITINQLDKAIVAVGGRK